MAKRCPTSSYLGVARLNDYRWQINSRGYANVVPVSAPSNSTVSVGEEEGEEEEEGKKESQTPYTDVVYGLVYALEAADEARLDRNEGVPEAYTKEMLVTDFWPVSETGEEGEEGKWVDVGATPKRKDMLVYIDRKRTVDDAPKTEYVYRMNMGIRDAVRLGVPREYVEKVMRRFVPEKDDDRVRETAMRQALQFEDET